MNQLNFLSCALGLRLLLKLNELLLLRLPKGTIVRVRYPEYVAGSTGVILSRERGANRWIIQVDNSFIQERYNPVILSLEVLDFDILEFPPFVKKTNSTLNNE